MKLFSKRGKGAKLGQHFLINTAVAETIARESGAEVGKTVLEIGPGKGVLTKELLARDATVVAVEKDIEMIEVLKEAFQKEIAAKKLHLLTGDARSTVVHHSVSEKIGDAPYSVAANIPYYITGELIRLFLTAPKQPNTIVLLIQKEVAERIARAKKESILSLSVKAYGTPSYIKTVKAGNFNPPPNVDSAILKIEDISRNYFRDISEKDFFELLHAGFGQKRKRLLGNLQKKYGHGVSIFEEELNLDHNIRAEDVPLHTWHAIAERLTHTS